MAEGRDFTAEAYQPPFMERYGPLIGGVVGVLILGGGLLWWAPWVDKGRSATVLRPDPPVRLSTTPEIFPSQGRPTHRVAMAGADVFVAWIDNRSEPPSLVLGVSHDTGKTFTEKVLDAPEGNRALNDPELLCDSRGSVYLLYTYSKSSEQSKSKTLMSGASAAGGGPLSGGLTEQTARLARSDDGARTWGQITNVASFYSGGMTDAVMGIDAQDVIHLAAISQGAGLAQVQVTHTTDRGASFAAAREVSQAPKGSRRDLAIGVSPAGRVAVVWSDRRNAAEVPENGEIFGSLANVGQEFAVEIPLIKPVLKPGRQRHPAVLLDDSGNLNIVFVEGIESTRRDRTALRFAHSATFGQTFDPSITLFGKQLTNPQSPQLVWGEGQHCYLTCVGTMTDRDQPTVVLAQSRNGGARFGALTPGVDRYAPTIQFPAIAAQGNTLILSYFDKADPAGLPGTAEVYAVRVEDTSL